MKQLLDYYTGKPIVDLTEDLPPLGEYYSKIIDCEYIPLDEVLGCIVIKYKLVNTISLDGYNFTEAYYCGASTPKTDAFYDYLEANGIVYELEEQLIGMREKVTITLDYLGGIEHPTVGKRTLIAKPPRLEEDEDSYEEDDDDCDEDYYEDRYK